MRTDLDRKFDETLAEVTGPGGRLIIDHDEQGRAFVANFPATLPEFFKIFCVLNGQVEAVVAGDERLTFADLDRWSDRLAKALVHRRSSGAESRGPPVGRAHQPFGHERYGLARGAAGRPPGYRRRGIP